MNWSMMEDLKHKPQYYQSLTPACEARESPIRACLPPVSDSPAIDANGQSGPELADDGQPFGRSAEFPPSPTRGPFHPFVGRRPRQADRTGHVYYIKVKGKNLIKIGFTSLLNLNVRLQELQTSCPYDLEFISVISGCQIEDERVEQRFFKDCRLRGEWFVYTRRMQEYLRLVEESHCERNGIPIEATKHYIVWEEFDDNAPSL